jgi:pyruvate/2-oxoglutarate dehydrogenase complex dihydrolipoamide dehydrogenase (E3) component
MESVQNLVIGSGEAGKYLAWALAKAGQRTVVVERSLIGGSCPNIACLPSKNIIHSAKVTSLIRRAREFGIFTGPVRLEMAGVFARKQQMVDDLVVDHKQRFRESGAELVMGTGRFTAPNRVELSLQSGGARLIEGARVFVNVGTHATLPDIPGLAAAKPMTHVEALDLDRLPEHLVILGGGFVGIEFAQALRRFGSKVTLIHRGDQLLNDEDPEVSGAVANILKGEGVNILFRSQLAEVEGVSGDRLHLRVQSTGVPISLEATDLLVATGRTPNTAGLDASRANIELDEAGYVRVNDRLETTASNTWAMGECAGSPKFTHAAFDDFRIIHSNLHGGNRTTRGRLIPYCVFTDPELARIGLSERAAEAEAIPYRVARLPMKAVLRTRTISEPEGFMKALIGEDDRILGFTALAAEASELLAAVQTAIIGGLTYQKMRDATFTHPTVAEGLGALFSNIPPSA